jgi:hypothetical protein
MPRRFGGWLQRKKKAERWTERLATCLAPTARCPPGSRASSLGDVVGFDQADSGRAVVSPDDGGVGAGGQAREDGSLPRGSQIRSELFRLTRSASKQRKRSSLMPSRTPGFEAPMSTRVVPVNQSGNGGSCRRSLPRAFYSGSADRTRQTLKSRPEVESRHTSRSVLTMAAVWPFRCQYLAQSG